MKNENIKRLADCLDTCNENNDSSFCIDSSQYVNCYTDIFIDEIKENNGMPLPYDRFSDKLVEHMKSTNPETLEMFMQIWTAWVDLYRELDRRGKIVIK